MGETYPLVDYLDAICTFTGNPDFTRGGKPEAYHDYNLGPTGARGWIYGKGTTAEARQILVTQVEKGSPADGILRAGDVILGVNGKRFDSDARRSIARAITEAEQTGNNGALAVVRWREGKRQDVTLKLEAMGEACLPGPFFSTVVVGGIALELSTAENLKREVLPKIASGELVIAFALVEPGNSYGLANIGTSATEDGDGYLLNGTKLFVEYANSSNYLLTVARVPDQGLALFLVVFIGKEKTLVRDNIKLTHTIDTDDRELQDHFIWLKIQTSDLSDLKAVHLHYFSRGERHSLPMSRIGASGYYGCFIPGDEKGIRNYYYFEIHREGKPALLFPERANPIANCI